jgi:hypothetical protein
MLTTLARPLDGLAFDVPDLLLARAWAAFHGLRMRIHLDRNDRLGQTDEVLAFHAKDDASPRWMAWRDDGMVCIQPVTGRTLRFARLSEALEDLIPPRAEPVTDLAGLPSR